MSEQESRGNENPQEEPEVTYAVSGKSETLISKSEAIDDGEPVEYVVADFLDEAFVSEPIPVVIDPTDGLPRPVDDFDRSKLAPPFNHESFVCMEDDRAWVEVFTDEDDRSWGGSFLTAVRSRWDESGDERERRQFSPSQVVEKWGSKWARDPEGSEAYIPVRPIRPGCVHYTRTVFCADPSIPVGTFGSQDLHRTCMARRSVGGAFMSLRDEAVYACEIRQPRDEKSELIHIRVKDKERLERVVEEVPLFNLHSKRSA